jgi:DNA-directed RNA polymerase
MYEAIREAFVEMYLGNDLYQNLLKQVMSNLSETATAPELPQRGNLDVSLVLQSKYCFS